MGLPKQLRWNYTHIFLHNFDTKIGVSSFRRGVSKAQWAVSGLVAPLSGASNGVSGGHSSAASGSLTSVTQVITFEFAAIFSATAVTPL